LFIVTGLLVAFAVFVRRPGDSDLSHGLRIATACISLGYPVMEIWFRALDYQVRAKRRRR
jgi:hypothetical protein